eukprot:g5839.t1
MDEVEDSIDRQYWEDHPDGGFGAGGFNSGLPHTEPEEQAWAHLIFSFSGCVGGTVVLWKMYQARDVLEIRARSVYLVMTLGICLLADLAIDVHVESKHLFGWPSNVLLTHLIYFFTIFTIESCYIWRVVRLGVSFSPRIKRAIPWIMSEQLAVASSIVVGLLSTFIPAYYYISTDGGHHIVRFALIDLDVVWKSQVALISVQLCLLPVVWFVDDIFRISWELSCIIMLGIIDIVVIRLSETSALTPGVKLFINSSNIGLLWTVALFGFSVVDPMRRLWMNPMARPITVSRKDFAGGLTRRFSAKKSGPRVTSDLSLRSLNGSQEDACYVSDSENEPDDGSTLRTKWSYDKMAAVPAVAEAFRAFAWRALCQESVMFLEEVSKYEKGDYSIAKPVVSQFAAFNHIIKRFVADGAVDEINIGSLDKDRLMFIFKDGSSAFFGQSEEQRRLIFREAFLEIRSMLETNLLHRFLHTEGFRSIPSSDTPPEPLSAGEP